MIDLAELTPEQAAGLSHVNAVANAERRAVFEAGEAAKPENERQNYVAESDQEYAERVVGGAFDSFARQRSEFLKEQVMPALDDSKLVGLQKYLTATPEVQAQVKQLLGM